MMNLDSSKATGPDCIPVVVLMTCEPELSYILAELFNVSEGVLFFQIVGKSHRWSLYLRMLGGGLQLKNYCLLSAVSIVFEKLVNNRLFDHLEK